MIEFLFSDYNAEEIKAAVFQMGPTKASGPDGMNALFYQKFWHIVGDDVIAPVLNFLNSDDSLIFCKASQEEVQVISEVLQTYAASSGQCINFEKSSVYFSSNTTLGDRERIKETMGVKEVERFESYLGLPTLVGRAKYQTFSFLKDRVWKKIQGWKGQLLSRAGKEILIKAVA
ncbi:uncharacterized protein LOC115970494 [Quercus lobata]|uniref:uncharacterized protein LOC115970494 n=1 Tax=Quercus lobata TaxID=97700 RepID=UPI00124742A9|nr:uncharacterized protein LOC115970494 [Quercus lobata]